MGSRQGRFVVQEHHARQLHYDFRLEAGGVLKSWALPKGPSMNPAEKRLAVLVEDHPLEYLEFEGIIPAGLPGAGEVVCWDAGVYRLAEGRDLMERFERGRLLLELEGRLLKGGFALFHMKGRGEKSWLLVKRKDAFSVDHWSVPRALTGERKRALKEKHPPCEVD